MNETGWELLDSGRSPKGSGLRIERFGERVLERPSSLAIWSRAGNLAVKPVANFDPDNGWRFGSGVAEEWVVDFEQFKLKLRLQSNGQVGFFPEHSTYLDQLCEFVGKVSQHGHQAPRVLNLFAYTGMATVRAALAGAHVTHVDIQKSAVRWAEENCALNEIPSACLRFICEDALAFLEREVRRGNQYDVVIADPPSFSRAAKNKSWDLEDVLSQLVECTAKLLKPQSSACFFTSHHPALGAAVISNLFRESLGANDKLCEYDCRALVLKEKSRERVLPAGELLIVRQFTR